jgi:membrane associated rhomboid family serine protease
MMLGRFPWATAALMSVLLVVFVGTWPRESSFLSARRPDAPFVVEAARLASLALDGESALPSDLRVRLEDLRAQAHFPDEESDRIFRSIDQTFSYLNTLKRLEWTERYAAYVALRSSLEKRHVPWHSIISRHVLRAGEAFWPRAATGLWIHFGIFHLLVVLYLVWLVGSHMEEIWGFGGILFLFTTGGLIGAATVYLLLPGGAWVLAGASGATASLLGGMLVRRGRELVRFFYVLGVTYGVFALPVWLVCLVWIPVEVNIGWLTQGRLDGTAAHLLHGAAALWGMGVGLGMGRRRRRHISVEDSPVLLDQLVEKGRGLVRDGKAEAAEELFLAVLDVHPTHIDALRELTAVHEFFQREDDAARTAVRTIRVAIEQGRGQLAEEIFRRWSLRLFQVRLPPQERLALAQNLESLHLWREALAYYNSVVEQSVGTAFAGKALFSSAKIMVEQMRNAQEAAKLLKILIDPPYDVEWRSLAEAELKTITRL